MDGHKRTIMTLVAALAAMSSSQLAIAGAVLNQERSGDEAPPELEGVDVTEHLGAVVPRDVRFTDDQGRSVTLGDVLPKDAPTILTFNYSDCPMLCSVELGGLVQALAKTDRVPGPKLHLVTISLDPTESVAKAHKTKERYLKQLANGRKAAKRPAAKQAENAWTFLVGKKEAVRKVADAVGFGYAFYAEKKQYLHPAAFMMVTPDGKVAQYVYGVSFKPEDMEGAMASAAMGVTSKTVQKFILSCYHYTPKKGGGAKGFKIMQLAGCLFAGGLILGLAGLHFRSRRSKRTSA